MYQTLFALIGLLFAAALSAEPVPPPPLPVLQIAIGENRMPYVSVDTQSGIEYELLTRALHEAGYGIAVHFVPNKRAYLQFARGELDAIIVTEGGIVSAPYIAYRNMAITLCDQQISLHKPADLASYQTGAFNSANKFLGKDFARIAQDPKHYREVSPQKLLNRMLWAQRIDVAVADINIFQHDQAEVDPEGSKPLCPFALFAPTLYRLEFRDPTVRDRVNQALSQLRASGFYEALAKKYKAPLDKQRPYFKP